MVAGIQISSVLAGFAEHRRMAKTAFKLTIGSRQAKNVPREII
jgi:hypothetical protein